MSVMTKGPLVSMSSILFFGTSVDKAVIMDNVRLQTCLSEGSCNGYMVSCLL